MKNKKYIEIVVICLITAGLSFWGGMVYASRNIKAASESRQGTFGQNGFNGQNGGRMVRGGSAGGFNAGKVISKDDKSITIQLSSGGSKIIFYSPTTTVEKNVSGQISDIVVGSEVVVTGAPNSDGSVNATSVQLKPEVANNIPVKQ